MSTNSCVVNKDQQEALATIAAELLKKCKIDYYPQEGRAFVYYYGPKKFNVIKQDVSAVLVKEVSHY